MADRIDVVSRNFGIGEIFSDFLVNLNAHPNTGFLLKRINDESIKRGLRNLIMTDRGERFFNPDFGGDIKHMLFELPTEFTSDAIKTTLKTAIENHEKRVRLIDINVNTTSDEQAYIIEIFFSTINNQEPQSLTVKMDRIR